MSSRTVNEVRKVATDTYPLIKSSRDKYLSTYEVMIRYLDKNKESLKTSSSSLDIEFHANQIKFLKEKTVAYKDVLRNLMIMYMQFLTIGSMISKLTSSIYNIKVRNRLNKFYQRNCPSPESVNSMLEPFRKSMKDSDDKIPYTINELCARIGEFYINDEL